MTNPIKMETNLMFFDGRGPFEYSEVTASEVSVLHNEATGSYILFLTTEEFGPVIVDKNLESAKAKFKEAFSKMLIMRSVMSVDDARAAAFKSFGCDDEQQRGNLVFKIKSTKSTHSIDFLVKKAKEERTSVYSEVDSLVM